MNSILFYSKAQKQKTDFFNYEAAEKRNIKSTAVISSLCSALWFIYIVKEVHDIVIDKLRYAVFYWNKLRKRRKCHFQNVLPTQSGRNFPNYSTAGTSGRCLNYKPSWKISVTSAYILTSFSSISCCMRYATMKTKQKIY